MAELEQLAKCSFEEITLPLKKNAIKRAQQILTDLCVKNPTSPENLKKIIDLMNKLKARKARKKLQRKESLLEILVELGKSLVFVDNDQAIEYLKDAVELALEWRMANEAGECLLILANISTMQGNFMDSIVYLHQYEELHPFLQNPKELNYIRAKIGEAYTIIEKFDLAMKYTSEFANPNEIELSSSTQDEDSRNVLVQFEHTDEIMDLDINEIVSYDLESIHELFFNDSDMEFICDDDSDRKPFDDELMQYINVHSTTIDVDTSDVVYDKAGPSSSTQSTVLSERNELSTVGDSIDTNFNDWMEIMDCVEELCDRTNYFACLKTCKDRIQSSNTDTELIDNYTELLYLSRKLHFHRLALISAKHLKVLYEKMKNATKIAFANSQISDLEEILFELKKPPGTVFGDVPDLPENDYLIKIKSEDKIGKEWYRSNVQGLLFTNRSDYNSAYIVFVNNLNVARDKMNNAYAVYETLRNIGFLFCLSRNYQMALNIFRELLAHAQKSKDDFMIITSYYFILKLSKKRIMQIVGNQTKINNSEVHYTKSLYFRYKCERLQMYARQKDDPNNYKMYWEEYDQFGYYQDAILAHHLLEKFVCSISARVLSQILCITLGDQYFHLGQFEIAQKYYKHALFLHQTVPNTSKLHANYKLYHIYNYLGDFGNVKRRLIKLHNLVKDYFHERDLHRIYEYYSNYHYAVGQYGKAYLAAELQYNSSKSLRDAMKMDRALRNEQELKILAELKGKNLPPLSNEVKLSIIL